MKLPTVSALAAEFDRLLRRDLTASDYREVRRLNRTPKYAGDCCASHDFLDANMAMLEALSNLSGMTQDEIVRTMFPEDECGMVPPESAAHNATDSEMLDLWNAAWMAWKGGE
jgi:hypothetical protein